MYSEKPSAKEKVARKYSFAACNDFYFRYDCEMCETLTYGCLAESEHPLPDLPAVNLADFHKEMDYLPTDYHMQMTLVRLYLRGMPG